MERLGNDKGIFFFNFTLKWEYNLLDRDRSLVFIYRFLLQIKKDAWDKFQCPYYQKYLIKLRKHLRDVQRMEAAKAHSKRMNFILRSTTVNAPKPKRKIIFLKK